MYASMWSISHGNVLSLLWCQPPGPLPCPWWSATFNLSRGICCNSHLGTFCLFLSEVMPCWKPLSIVRPHRDVFVFIRKAILSLPESSVWTRTPNTSTLHQCTVGATPELFILFICIYALRKALLTTYFRQTTLMDAVGVTYEMDMKQTVR